MRSTHWPSLIFVPINEQLHTVVVCQSCGACGLFIDLTCALLDIAFAADNPKRHADARRHSCDVKISRALGHFRPPTVANSALPTTILDDQPPHWMMLL